MNVNIPPHHPPTPPRVCVASTASASSHMNVNIPPHPPPPHRMWFQDMGRAYIYIYQYITYHLILYITSIHYIYIHTNISIIYSLLIYIYISSIHYIYIESHISVYSLLAYIYIHIIYIYTHTYIYINQYIHLTNYIYMYVYI